MNELKESLQKFFNWSDRPITSQTATEAPLVSNATSPEGLQVYHIPEALEKAFMGVMLFGNLQPDTVYLKRPEQTFELFRKDSRGNVLDRIAKARKCGMDIAPHTCIRETIFAEPRIDLHFAYTDVLSAASTAQGNVHKTLVDVECCMGTDIRKLVLDGFRTSQAMISSKGSLKLAGSYTTTKEPRTLLHCGTLTSSRRISTVVIDLDSSFDFVHSANVIHLYSHAQQLDFLRALVFLAKPNGLVWGRQVGLQEDEFIREYRQPEGKGARYTVREFQSLIEEATGWEKAEINYEGQMVEYDELRIRRPDKRCVLQWRVRVPAQKGCRLERVLELSE